MDRDPEGGREGLVDALELRFHLHLVDQSHLTTAKIREDKEMQDRGGRGGRDIFNAEKGVGRRTSGEASRRNMFLEPLGRSWSHSMGMYRRN